jgi:hypothetical protein
MKQKALDPMFSHVLQHQLRCGEVWVPRPFILQSRHHGSIGWSVPDDGRYEVCVLAGGGDWGELNAPNQAHPVAIVFMPG